MMTVCGANKTSQAALPSFKVGNEIILKVVKD